MGAFGRATEALWLAAERWPRWAVPEHAVAAESDLPAVEDVAAERPLRQAAVIAATHGPFGRVSTVQQTAIFGPVLATMFLTFLVWVYMYFQRISFINRNNISAKDLAVPGALAGLYPPEVSNPSDNLKNLFEIPVLFYALALYLFVTSQVDGIYVAAAWAFVVFRMLHSAVHCTINIVMFRFCLYLISTLAVWFIAARAALRYLGA